MPKDKNTFGKNIGLLFGSIILSIVLVEIALRIVLPSPIIWKFPQENYIYDPEIGHWLEAKQKAFTHDKEVITNSVGIRDAEYSSKAPPGVYRILALGDSQTFGNGLELKDTWPKQLETRLNKLNNKIRYEVLNSGLPASDNWQHEIIFERMISNYHPDALVLAFYVNDVVRRFTPNPSMHQSGNDFEKRIIYLLKRSALLLTLRKSYDSIRQALALTGSHQGEQDLLRGEGATAIEERWQQVDASLSAMKKLADKNNITFMMVSLPRRDHVDGRLAWDAYNENLQAIAERYQIPMLSMLEPLQQAYMEHKRNLFIPWDGHNSGIANQVIAQEISKAMLSGIGPNMLSH